MSELVLTFEYGGLEELQARQKERDEKDDAELSARILRQNPHLTAADFKITRVYF